MKVTTSGIVREPTLKNDNELRLLVKLSAKFCLIERILQIFFNCSMNKEKTCTLLILKGIQLPQVFPQLHSLDIS